MLLLICRPIGHTGWAISIRIASLQEFEVQLRSAEHSLWPTEPDEYIAGLSIVCQQHLTGTPNQGSPVAGHHNIHPMLALLKLILAKRLSNRSSLDRAAANFARM